MVIYFCLQISYLLNYNSINFLLKFKTIYSFYNALIHTKNYFLIPDKYVNTYSLKVLIPPIALNLVIFANLI